MKNQMETIHKSKSPSFIKRFKLIPLWAVLLIFSTVVLMVSGVFAWFLAAYNLPGASVTTGKIDVAFRSYKCLPTSDGLGYELVRYLDEQSGSSDSICLADVLQRDVGLFSENKQTDDIYIVVEKNDGCIPLDFQLAFGLVGLKDNRNYITDRDSSVVYAGGFCYRLQEVTDQVRVLIDSTSDLKKVSYYEMNEGLLTKKATDSVTKIEKALFKYAKNNPVNMGASLPLTSIEDELAETRTLRESNFCVYHLTISASEGANQSPIYSNASFNIELSLNLAQIGGFEPNGTTKTHYVSSVSDLNSILYSYSPGDSIVLKSNITYTGDLIFTRPVGLYLNFDDGYKLTVKGNLIFSYPYKDTFTINTEKKGQICVLKTDNAGGNFRADIPNCSLIMTGAGKTDVGEADYYVENEVYFNTSCIPTNIYDTGTTGYGVTIERASIMCGTGNVSEINKVIHPLYLKNNTQLTVANDTTIGQVLIDTIDDKVERVVIINYGTISETIALSSLSIDTTGRYNYIQHSPQIFIDNYGTISKSILLPETAERFSTIDYTGNTRIIHEMDSTDVGVGANSIFRTEDIEQRVLTREVVDLTGEGTDLYVYYVDLLPDDGETVSLESILTEHIRHFKKSENNNTNNKEQIKNLAIETIGDCVLTDADYEYLRSLVNLEVLDLSGCTTGTGISKNIIPANAFSGLTKLYSVSLPSEATELSSNVFTNTSVIDLYLPSKMKKFAKTSLDGVRGVHIGYSNEVIVSNLLTDSTGKYRYLFLPYDSLLETYRNNNNYTNYKQYLFKEATHLRGTDLYYRIVSGSDVEIVAYVGSPIANDDTTISNISFSGLKLEDGSGYKISRFGDYSFYKKIIQVNGETLTPTFSDVLDSIGAYAFAYNTALVGDINLTHVVTIDTYAFYGCSNIRSVRGNEALKIGSYAFYDCKSLLAASFPKAELYGYAFYECQELRIVETRVYSIASESGTRTNNVLKNCKKLVAWVLHTENSTLTAKNFEISGAANTYNASSALSGVSSNYRILVSTSTDNVSKLDYYTKIKGQNGKIISTGLYTADTYLFADSDFTIDDNGLVRDNCGTDESPLYYSGFGYGDYIFAVDKISGEATMIYCMIPGLSGQYHVPSTILEQNLEPHAVVRLATSSFNGKSFSSGSTITIPNTLREIEASTFASQKGITGTVDLNMVETIGVSVFNGCTGISALDMGSVLKDVPDTAFKGCSQVLTLEMPLVETIGTSAFESCTQLQTLTASNVEIVGDSAFNACASLVCIDLPKALSIGNNAFYNCSSITFARGPLVKTIGQSTFYKNISLIAANFPRAELNYYSFYGCEKLQIVETAVYSRVNSTNGNKALDGCKKLRAWILHPEYSNVDSIMAYTYAAGNTHPAFYYGTFPGKYRIFISESTENELGLNYYSLISGQNTNIRSTGDITANNYFYANDPNLNTASVRAHWGDSDNPQYYSDIGYGDYLCTRDPNTGEISILACLLETVGGDYSIPTILVDTATGETVTPTRVNEYAFYISDFTMGTTLKFPITISTIDNDAFRGIANLSGMVDLSYVKTLGTNAFYGCSRINEIVLPKDPTFTTVPNYLCYQCSSLSQIDFGPYITTVGSYAFYQCNSLEYLDNDNITNVGQSAFGGCQGLIRVKMVNLGILKDSAFANCTRLLAAETKYPHSSSGTGLFNQSSNMRLWIVHTEHGPLATEVKSYSNNNVPSTCVVLISSSIENDNGVDYYTTPTNLSGANNYLNTGAYNCSNYIYANDTRRDIQVIRASVKDRDDKTVYLSDIGYGDYVLGRNYSGQITLIACVLKEIDGSYMVPSKDNFEFLHGKTEDIRETDNLTEIGMKSYVSPVMASCVLSFPDPVISIGDKAFIKKTGLTGFLDFNHVQNIGNSAFSNCSGLLGVTGLDVTWFGDYTFESCSNLMKAVFPQGTSSFHYTFQYCKNLAVIETTIWDMQSGYHSSCRDCMNLRLWIMHPEFSKCTSMYVHSFGDSHGYGLADSPGSNISLRYQFLVSNDATVPPAKKSQYSVMTSGAAAQRVINTYQYLPYDYVWMNETSDSVTRYKVTVNGQDYYLSDLGYGDYCFGIDKSDGQAELLCCLLDSINNNYATPTRVVNTTGELVAQKVKTISHRAFYYTAVVEDVKFNVSEGITLIRTSGLAQHSIRGPKAFTTMTLPSSLTKMESGAMTDATSLKELYINNVFTGVESTNIFSSAADFVMEDLSVFVNESVYKNYYSTLPNARWGNIPLSCFVVSFIEIQDGENAPIYYFAQKNDTEENELILTYISNVEDVTELIIPSFYLIGDPDNLITYTVTEIAWNAFLSAKDIQSVKKIVLPDKLKTYDHVNTVYPVNFKEFVIDEDNQYFETKKGVLYNKGKTVLIAYPKAKEIGTFTIPEEVAGIAQGAFTDVKALIGITVQEDEEFLGYLFISSGAFNGCTALETIKFGKSVMIANNAYVSCGNLQNVIYLKKYSLIYLGNTPFGASAPEISESTY